MFGFLLERFFCIFGLIKFLMCIGFRFFIFFDKKFRGFLMFFFEFRERFLVGLFGVLLFIT